MRTGIPYVYIILFLTLFAACSTPGDGEEESGGCAPTGQDRIEFGELLGMYRGSPTKVSTKGYLEGVVISSDREGNIFGTIYLQDQPGNPEIGIAIMTDLVGSDAHYPPGTRVAVSLKGLYLGRQDGGYALGTVREIFGNPILDRIPALATSERLVPVCGEAAGLQPRVLRAELLDSVHLHTLIRIEDIEIPPEYEGGRFADPGLETIVPLSGCSGARLGMVNSGYSDFSDRPLPPGSGSATGILLGKAPEFRLLLRYASDLDISGPSCEERYPPVSSQAVFISEIADPENEPGGRFLELYNAGDQPLDLKGWKLMRYTNANTEPGKPADLEGMRLEAGGTLVLSASPETFESLYGFPPDGVLSANGPADSNGDDTIVLTDPFDEPIDVFGVPGEDGSGTSHEFEDGGAFRRAAVRTPNPLFEPSQWDVYNDSGGNGTIDQPLTAPGDFSPGTHTIQD